MVLQRKKEAIDFIMNELSEMDVKKSSHIMQFSLNIIAHKKVVCVVNGSIDK